MDLWLNISIVIIQTLNQYNDGTTEKLLRREIKHLVHFTISIISKKTWKLFSTYFVWYLHSTQSMDLINVAFPKWKSYH